MGKREEAVFLSFLLRDELCCSYADLFNDSGAAFVYPKGEFHLMVSKVEQEELKTTSSVSMPSVKLPLHEILIAYPAQG